LVLRLSSPTSSSRMPESDTATHRNNASFKMLSYYFVHLVSHAQTHFPSLVTLTMYGKNENMHDRIATPPQGGFAIIYRPSWVRTWAQDRVDLLLN
jgi:hypothetical protein